MRVPQRAGAQSAHLQRNNDEGHPASRRKHVRSTSAPSLSREEHRVPFLAPHHLWDSPAGDLSPLRPQQSQGKVTCESPPCVRGRNGGCSCSHVTGAPAKRCTSGTAVNKAGEATAESSRGQRGPPASQQLCWGGKGVEINAEAPCGAQNVGCVQPAASPWKPLCTPGHPRRAEDARGSSPTCRVHRQLPLHQS